MNIFSPSQIISCTDLASCFQSLYNFLFALLLFLAFLYFLFGAFKYLLSGANIFSQDEGKKMMKNSVIALIIVLVVPVILNTINPDIFRPVLSIPKISAKLPELYFKPIPGYRPGAGTSDIEGVNRSLTKTKNYKEATKIQACEKYEESKYSPNSICKSVDSLAKEIKYRDLGYEILSNKSVIGGPSYFKILRAICILESDGDSFRESRSDRCMDKTPFSIGLFQINMAVHEFTYDVGGEIIHCHPKKMFDFYIYRNGIWERADVNLDFYDDLRLFNCKLKRKGENENEVDENARRLYYLCKSALQNQYFNLIMAYRVSKNWATFTPWTTYKYGISKCLDKFKETGSGQYFGP